MLGDALAAGVVSRSWEAAGEFDVEAVPVVMRRLLARCHLVQVVERTQEARWQELHRAVRDGAGAMRPARRPAEGAHPPLDWVAEQDLERVAGALDRIAAEGGAWRGVVRTAKAPAEPLSLDVEIHREPGSAWQRCSIIATDLGAPVPMSLPREDLREQLSLVEAALELGIIEYDLHEDVLRLDAAALALFGLARGNGQSIGLAPWLALLVEDDRPAARRLLSRSIPAGQTERVTVRLAPAETKQSRQIELSLRTAAGGRSVVAACRDVTRERSLEELRRKKLAAERASQAKSEFMSHVSHELRTPLNAILGFAQLMTMDPDHPLAQAHVERLEMVQHSGQRLLGLIDQLLQITKIERGKQTLRIKSVNVRQLVKHCVDALQIAAAERGIEISVDIERPELSSVRADADALEQAVTNLLSNAIKYNRDHGRVRITFRAGEMGELTVDDTGKGLSESQLGRMFEPFDRLDADRSLVPGTGLGLVITKQLVEAMGGTLRVWSEVGKGSRFKIDLPLARRSRHTAPNSLPLEFPSQWDAAREHSVLYIEDDEVNVVLMEQLFRTQPAWRLRCAATGVEGLTEAVRQRPDVILLDMNLPDMSGIDVFKRLRADPRTSDIRCVAVSADAVPVHISRVHALGFDDYWTKPLDLKATVGKLKRMLR
jgi:signal transduction histidine kinase